MYQTPVPVNESALTASGEEEREYVTMKVAGQELGLPVLDVEDVIRPRKLTKVPLAPRDIAGVLNLRGRVVTAVDMRVRLGLPAHENHNKCMSIVTNYGNDLYSFLVDEVGDVLSLPKRKFEKCPANMEKKWKDVASGVYSLEGKLLVILDVDRLLSFS